MPESKKIKTNADNVKPILQRDYSSLIQNQLQLGKAVLKIRPLLIALIDDLTAKAATYPQGALRVMKKRTTVHYYYVKPHERKTGTYLPFKTQQDLITALAQKSYEAKILRLAKRSLSALDHGNSMNISVDFLKVYEDLSKERKKLVTPIFPSDEEYIKHWKNIHKGNAPFRESDLNYSTDNGESVRSKSEIIIANVLKAMNVPYCYEPILQIESSFYRPDFIILNVRKRKEYYWEHMGMMDNEDYSANAYKKLSIYEAHGIYPGENLILTFESSSAPLNTNEIKALINHFCL